MVLLDELRVTMSDYRKDLKELYEVLGIEKAQARYDALQKQVADPDFYSDLENSQKVLQEVKSLENRIEKYQKMEETLDDILNGVNPLGDRMSPVLYDRTHHGGGRGGIQRGTQRGSGQVRQGTGIPETGFAADRRV
mgnify:CR=1 FL=1